MEFPELGKHCAEPTCHQLDFLPFVCASCGGVFCLEHSEIKAHSCSNTHSQKKTVTTQQESIQSTPVSGRCEVHGCRNRELVPFSCTRCNKVVCVKHRLPETHQCPADLKNEGRTAGSGIASSRNHNNHENKNKSSKPADVAKKREYSGGSSAQPISWIGATWPMCSCTPPLPCAMHRTRKSGPNYGRQFYVCNKKGGGKCKYFQWADGKPGNGEGGQKGKKKGKDGACFKCGRQGHWSRDCHKFPPNR